MPSMEISTDHYDISYVITGDRKAITPLAAYSYHSGDVATGAPYSYHRTVAESDTPYSNYLIKFTPDFIKPFIEQVGKNIFDTLINQRIFRFSETEKIKKMFVEMLEEYNKNTPYKEFILQGMLNRLLVEIFENTLDVYTEKYNPPLTEPVLDAIYYIEENYSKKITLDKISKKQHFSPTYFSKLFKKQLGISFTEYLNNVRIDHAKKQLVKTNKSVMEIALDIGYCNGDYLSSQFKNKTGMTPLEFRKQKARL